MQIFYRNAFQKIMLNSSNMPNTMLGTEDIAMKKADVIRDDSLVEN